MLVALNINVQLYGINLIDCGIDLKKVPFTPGSEAHCIPGDRKS